MNDQNVHPDSPDILVASPWSDDHRRLSDILEKSDMLPRVQGVESVQAAMAAVRMVPMPVAIAECELPDGTWRKLLDEFQQLAAAPMLIIASAHADDYLWAEALNLGAFDVLAKPFDAAEVTRVVSWAWLRWCESNRRNGGFEWPHKKCAAAKAVIVSTRAACSKVASQAAH